MLAFSTVARCEASLIGATATGARCCGTVCELALLLGIGWLSVRTGGRRCALAPACTCAEASGRLLFVAGVLELLVLVLVAITVACTVDAGRAGAPRSSA